MQHPWYSLEAMRSGIRLDHIDRSRIDAVQWTKAVPLEWHSQVYTAVAEIFENYKNSKQIANNSTLEYFIGDLYSKVRTLRDADANNYGIQSRVHDLDWTGVIVEGDDFEPLNLPDPELVLATRVRTREMERDTLEALLAESRA